MGFGPVFVIASVSSANSFRQTTPRHITQMGDDVRPEYVQDSCNTGIRVHGDNALNGIPGTYHKTRWGEDMSCESMLEHAVMHPHRHRFQLEELMEAQG
jgi:hypothetical protein